MAITRSQIARQLLAEGGVSLDDAKAMAPEGEFLAYINPREAQMLKDAGGSGIMTPMGIPSFVDFTDSSQGISAADTFSAAASGGASNPGGFGNNGGGDGGGNQPSPTGPKGPTITGGDTDYQQYITQNPYGRQVTDFQRNVARGVVSAINPVAGMTVNQILAKEQEKQKDLQKAISGGQQFFGTTPRSLTTQFRETTGLKTGPSGPPGGGGGDSPIIPKLPQVAQLPTDIETPASDLQKSFDVRFFLDPRFEAKDGGEVTVDQAEKMAPPGESLAYINDDEAALLRAIGGAGEPVNQTGIPSYFIKKIFKKAAKAVKKVVKSDAFKVAAAIGFGAYAGGLGPFSAAGKFGGLKGAGFARGLFAGKALSPGAMGGKTPGIKAFLQRNLGKLASKPGLGIAAASIAGGLMTPKQEQEDELSTKISDETGLPIAQIRKEVQEATAQGQDALDALKDKYPFLVRADSALVKDGGKIKEAGFYVKKKKVQKAADGGIMNLDGMEMDLRGGGFVPIGKAEKADDVPSSLSKNEFVFTADAVRAAGGGSVDKGADLMYKTMKQLEDRVA